MPQAILKTECRQWGFMLLWKNLDQTEIPKLRQWLHAQGTQLMGLNRSKMHHLHQLAHKVQYALK